MKSYKSVKGGLAVLPTLVESSVDSSASGEGSSPEESSSPSLDQLDGHRGDATANYPADLLGMSWGSYLNSGPPTRTGGQLRAGLQAMEAGGEQSIQSEACACEALKAVNEPHPLLQHLEGLMVALTRSKQELTKCGLDATPLTNLSGATLSSHSDLKQIVRALAKGGTNCDNVVITSDLMHNLVEYMREVLQGLVSQGRKLNVQAAFLQQTAKQLSRQQQECLKEQAKCQEAIDKDRILLNREKVQCNADQ